MSSVKNSVCRCRMCNVGTSAWSSLEVSSLPTYFVRVGAPLSRSAVSFLIPPVIDTQREMHTTPMSATNCTLHQCNTLWSDKRPVFISQIVLEAKLCVCCSWDNETASLNMGERQCFSCVCEHCEKTRMNM